MPPAEVPSGNGKTRWYHALPPHVFLFCFVVVLGSVIMAPSLSRWTGDVLYQGTVVPGENVTFEVPEAGTTVFTDFTSQFPRSPTEGQNATLEVRDPTGGVVFNTSVSVTPSVEGSDERNVRVLLPVPTFKPSVTGTYTATYTFFDGDASASTLKVTQGGLSVRHATSSFLFYVIMGLFLLGFACLWFIRGGDPHGKGLDRFLPIRGATKTSLLVTLLVALAFTWALLFTGAGGLV